MLFLCRTIGRSSLLGSQLGKLARANGVKLCAGRDKFLGSPVEARRQRGARTGKQQVAGAASQYVGGLRLAMEKHTERGG